MCFEYLTQKFSPRSFPIKMHKLFNRDLNSHLHTPVRFAIFRNTSRKEMLHRVKMGCVFVDARST